MNKEQTEKNVDEYWESWFVPGLSDFIAVPNLTTMVDPEYLTNGLVEKAIELVDGYINKLQIQGMTRKIYRAENGLPLVVYVVEPSQGVTKNLLVYGHLDKQPYGDGWYEDCPPDKPTRKGDLLYGRGSSDDGYAPFSAMLAIKNAQIQGVKMPRIALVLETEEESGSPNLVKLLGIAEDSIGTPDVCFCLDSGCNDYERMWLTSSLRGICIIDLTVEVGCAGYHSGEVGGIVPETFRVVRQLLDRLDDSKTGKVCPELHMELPGWKVDEAKLMASLKGDDLCKKYAVVEGAQYMNHDNLEQMYTDNTWNPNMSITGADHLP
jgi:acetylornithine deacetylase/succinyl-diaminopimelate desuccinylase-like protein